VAGDNYSGAVGVKWLAAAGYGLLVIAFGACAVALARVDRVGPAPAVVPPLAAADASG
jgi:hypothetical protein